MAVGAYVTVPAPARQPHRYGLFSAATIVDTTTPHEQMGVQWSPLPCDRPDYWPHDCPTPPDATKTPTTQPPTQHALPITIYGSFECRLVGYSITEATARAREHLTAGEQHAVEYALWTGISNNTPTLTGADTLDLGTASCPAALLSLIYAHTDTHFVGEPLIHIPRAAVPWFGDQLVRDNGRLTTKLGTPVAAGAGYSEANTGPTGEPAPDGAFWVYATGPIVLRRGPIHDVPTPAHQGFNTRTNDFTALSERRYLAMWDCLTVAALFTPRCG